MFEKILLAVDESDAARNAAKYGLALARQVGASVDALHVVDHGMVQLPKSATQSAAQRTHGKALLKTVKGLAADEGIPLTTELVEGRPSARISAYAADEGCGLVVLGMQGKRGVSGHILGSVAESVLHQVDCPILVVPTGVERPDIDNILFPTDGSADAKAAIPIAAGVAEAFGAELHVINVVDLQAAGGAFAAGGVGGEFVANLERQGTTIVAEAQASVAAIDPDLPVSVDVIRVNGFGGDAAAICEYARDHGVDMVVMGSAGRSSISRQLLGSVTSGTLHASDVPVLVVKQPTA